MSAADNTSMRLIVMDRRRQIAALRLRGYTQREIQKGLAEADPPVRNPKNGEPWSLGTINSDVKALEAAWQTEMVSDVAAHKSRIFAELREVARAAWKDKDLERVLKAIQQQRDLLGTDAAKAVKAEVTGKDGAALNPAPSSDLSKLTNGQLDQLEQLLVALATADAGPGSG